MQDMGTWVMLGLWVLGAVLALVWIFVPFAILGTKPLLRALVEEQKRSNELLASIERHLGRREAAAHAGGPRGQPQGRIEPRL